MIEGTEPTSQSSGDGGRRSRDSYLSPSMMCSRIRSYWLVELR